MSIVHIQEAVYVLEPPLTSRYRILGLLTQDLLSPLAVQLKPLSATTKLNCVLVISKRFIHLNQSESESSNFLALGRLQSSALNPQLARKRYGHLNEIHKFELHAED